MSGNEKSVVITASGKVVLQAAQTLWEKIEKALEEFDVTVSGGVSCRLGSSADAIADDAVDRTLRLAGVYMPGWKVWLEGEKEVRLRE